MPCEECIRADLTSECNAQGATMQEETENEGGFIFLTKHISDNFIHVLNVPTRSADIISSTQSAFVELDNVSPLQIYESLTSNSLVTLYLMLLSCATTISFPGTPKYVLQVKRVMEQISSFTGEKAVQPIIERLNKLSKITLNDLRPPQSMVIPPAITVLDSEVLNSIPKYNGLSTDERMEVDFMLESGGADFLMDLAKVERSRIGTMLVRLSLSQSEDKPLPTLKHQQFYLNYTAENLFGYTSQELKHYLDVRLMNRGKDGANPIL
jgi:hypothetical protein